MDRAGYWAKPQCTAIMSAATESRAVPGGCRIYEWMPFRNHPPPEPEGDEMSIVLLSTTPFLELARRQVPSAQPEGYGRGDRSGAEAQAERENDDLVRYADLL